MRIVEIISAALFFIFKKGEKKMKHDFHFRKICFLYSLGDIPLYFLKILQK